MLYGLNHVLTILLLCCMHMLIRQWRQYVMLDPASSLSTLQLYPDSSLPCHLLSSLCLVPKYLIAQKLVMYC